MKKEDVRSEGRGQQFTVDGFLEPYVQSVHAPCLYLLPPSRCPSWCPGTGPDHMSRSVFGLHRLRGPPHVVIRSTCHFPVPRLAVCPLVWARLAYFILPPAQQHAFSLADFICLPSIAVHATRSMFPVLGLFPLFLVQSWHLSLL